MSLLDDTRSVDPATDRDRDAVAEPTIDLTGEGAAGDDGPEPEGARDPRVDSRTAPRVDPSGRMPVRGMRVQRVRLASVAQIAAVFFTLGFVVVLGTLVVLWNVAQTTGFVADLEETITTSLGLDAFEIDGGALFGVVAVGVGGLAVFGWVLTILLAGVYNATCAAFGGLAMETAPLQRRRRVFSLRHRRFVTIRA